LLPVLTGQRAHPALHCFGSVRYLARPMPYRRWWGRRRNPQARDWLLAERGLTTTEAADALDRVGVPSDLRIGSIDWNERTMLALEALLFRVPDLLVFDTSGNGPDAEERIFARLTSRPANLALLYLRTHGGPDALCLPRSTCIALESCPAQTATVE
jgi:hypothetical protein